MYSSWVMDFTFIWEKPWGSLFYLFEKYVSVIHIGTMPGEREKVTAMNARTAKSLFLFADMFSYSCMYVSASQCFLWPCLASWINRLLPRLLIWEKVDVSRPTRRVFRKRCILFFFQLYIQINTFEVMALFKGIIQRRSSENSACIA